MEPHERVGSYYFRRDWGRGGRSHGRAFRICDDIFIRRATPSCRLRTNGDIVFAIKNVSEKIFTLMVVIS